jgi:hypothetical protein
MDIYRLGLLILAVIVWLLLVRVILPRLGIPT